MKVGDKMEENEEIVESEVITSQTIMKSVKEAGTAVNEIMKAASGTTQAKDAASNLGDAAVIIQKQLK